MISIVRYHSVLNPPHLKPGCNPDHQVVNLIWFDFFPGENREIFYSFIFICFSMMYTAIFASGHNIKCISIYTFDICLHQWYLGPHAVWHLQAHCLVGASLSLLNTAAPLLSRILASTEGKRIPLVRIHPSLTHSPKSMKSFMFGNSAGTFTGNGHVLKN